MKSTQDTRLKNAIRTFLGLHPAGQINTNLTRLLLAYLENIGDCQPGYHTELISDLEGLVDLLRALETGGAENRPLVPIFN